MLTRMAPDPRGGELQHDPFKAIGRPDADAVAASTPCASRPERPASDLIPQLAIGERKF